MAIMTTEQRVENEWGGDGARQTERGGKRDRKREGSGINRSKSARKRDGAREGGGGSKEERKRKGFVYVCMYVCMYACVCVCVRACARACTYILISWASKDQPCAVIHGAKSRIHVPLHPEICCKKTL